MTTPNREQRAALARETLAIVRAGGYRNDRGEDVRIDDDVHACIDATRLFLPSDPDDAGLNAATPTRRQGMPTIAVRDESTIVAALRLAAAGATRVGVLNFASARNPGGGFESGSQAQEEALARSSALHASLVSPQAFPFYEHHRAQRSALYTDRVILSPDCPLFRDADGALLAAPVRLTFLTCAAPNARAVAANEPERMPLIPEVIDRRAERVLAVAAYAGCDALVLGAWGCGVFGNDPAMVAAVFARMLARRVDAGASVDRVDFAVLDSSPGKLALAAFRRTFEMQVQA